MRTVMNLPVEVEEVFRKFFTCELSTLAKDGTPVSWPIEPYYQAQTGQFLMATAIGLAKKMYNLQRNPHVSLLFSNPTGSGLVNPPAVLVQADARATSEIITKFDGELAEAGRVFLSRQPAAEMYSSNPLMRYLFDWYYMRLIIHFTPRRVLWWEHADFSQAPKEIEVKYVD